MGGGAFDSGAFCLSQSGSVEGSTSNTCCLRVLSCEVSDIVHLVGPGGVKDPRGLCQFVIRCTCVGGLRGFLGPRSLPFAFLKIFVHALVTRLFGEGVPMWG